MYLYGEILDVDYQQAKIWYEKAADQMIRRAGQTRCDVCKWSRGKSGLSAIKNYGMKRRLRKMMLMRNFASRRCMTMVSGKPRLPACKDVV
ncbi:MAG: SEL1-like repeat protein [Escherichia sp.]